MTDATRFSKARLLESLEEQMEEIRQTYDFDPSRGWSQVDQWDINVQRAVGYGRFSMLQNLIEDLS